MKEYLKSYSNEILAKFRRISSLIKHSPSIGRFHEEIIVNFIRGFLSNRYSLKTGFVIDVDTKELSNQTDILIIDENVPNPYVFQEKDFCLARPRAVVCGIEIKSKLDKKKFRDSVLAAKKFRSVCKSGQFLVFSFSSVKTFLKRIHSWYQDIDTVKDDILYYPSMISCLDFGCLLLVPEKYATLWGHYPLIKTDTNQRGSCFSLFFIYRDQNS